MMMVVILFRTFNDACSLCTGWAKKRGHRLMTTILSNLNRFKKKSLQKKVNLQLNGY